jgi:hypothetical protein
MSVANLAMTSALKIQSISSSAIKGHLASAGNLWIVAMLGYSWDQPLPCASPLAEGQAVRGVRAPRMADFIIGRLDSEMAAGESKFGLSPPQQ